MAQCSYSKIRVNLTFASSEIPGTSEMPGVFNFTKSFIDFFAKIGTYLTTVQLVLSFSTGWAYDLRVIAKDTINRQMERQFDNVLKQQVTSKSYHPSQRQNA